MQAPAVTLLHAARISLAAPLPAAGSWPSTVHSVYRGAVNVSTPGGLLVVAPAESGGLPNGVLVTGAVDFRALRLGPGDDVALAAGAIRLGGSLVVGLATATPWSPVLPVATRPREAAAHWRRRSARVHRVAAAHGHPRGLAAVPGAEAALHAVARAIDTHDRRSATRAARRLIGLGPGLTPSGDDALAGLEAALHATAHPLAGFLGGALDDIDDRTTTVSAALLRHAARGELAERVHRLLAALLGDDDMAPDDAVIRASAWGATSGSDGVTGVLLGLDAATGTTRRVRVAA